MEHIHAALFVLLGACIIAGLWAVDRWAARGIDRVFRG